MPRTWFHDFSEIRQKISSLDVGVDLNLEVFLYRFKSRSVIFLEAFDQWWFNMLLLSSSYDDGVENTKSRCVPKAVIFGGEELCVCPSMMVLVIGHRSFF